MRRDDALRLKVGTLLHYGNSAWLHKCSFTRWGHVVKVTERGGIIVNEYDANRPSGRETVVPYHHVISTHGIAPSVVAWRRKIAMRKRPRAVAKDDGAEFERKSNRSR
jgi:hypothetical protein